VCQETLSKDVTKDLAGEGDKTPHGPSSELQYRCPKSINNTEGGKSRCSTTAGSTGFYIGDNPNQRNAYPTGNAPFPLYWCEGTMPEEQHNNTPATGRRVSIIERWPCGLEACRNHGQMCYWTISDEVANHLPITSIIMQYWLAAISRGECTADVPPQAIIEQWAARNLRSLQRREERKEVRRVQRAERKSSTQKSSTRMSSTRRSSPRKSSVPSKG